MALLSDLPKSEAVASLLVQDCRDPLTSHSSVMFRAAFAFVKIIIGTKGKSRTKLISSNLSTRTRQELVVLLVSSS